MSNASKILDLAAREVGYHEGKSGGHWNNREKYAAQVPGLEWADGQAWCATFVSWAAFKSGLAKFYPCTASTDAGAAWFKDKGQWHDFPAVGAQVFYGHAGDMTHTGLVESYDSTHVTAIEGNTNTSGSAEGDGVYRKVRLRRDEFVQGYGYPAFPEGLKSADPDYEHAHPAGAKTPTRLQQFHTQLTKGPVDLRLLDAAVAAGRAGKVKAVRDQIDAEMKRLAKAFGHEKGTRVATALAAWRNTRVVRLGVLTVAAKSRPGLVRSVAQNISKAAHSAPVK